MSSASVGVVISGVLLALTVASGVVLSSSGASAEEAIIDTLNVKINSACTLSGTGTGTHNTTVNPGAYVSEIGTTTLKAMCNDANGFSIYAAGYTGNIVGETNSNKLVGRNNGGTIASGIATSGDTSNWAMKLATDSTATYPITITSAPNTSGGADASFASYHVVPNEYTKVATRTQATDVGVSATGSTLTTTYATFISAGQVGDTYDGKVIYTLVHPNDHATPVAPLLATDCPANKICYAPNANDIDGSMESISTTKITKSPTAGVQNAGSNGTYTLIAPNYSRAGYGFAGWSTEFDAVHATDPVIYGPNQTITTSTTAGTGDADVSQHGLILYPVWVESAGTMQSNVSTVCSNLEAASYDGTAGTLSASLSSISALTDERDDNTYAIAKLADGNCWMIENLRLNADDTLGDTNKALAQGYGDDTTNNRGKFIGLADSEDTNFTGSTSSATDPTNANSLYYAGTQSGTATMNIGQVNYAGMRIPRYNNNNTNLASNATNSAGVALTDSYSTNNDHVRWYGYGNYYNWPAAMASTTYYSGPTATDSNGKTSETAGTSLCPKNWQLPYGRATGNGALSKGFYHLGTQMDATTDNAASSKMWRSFPNNFVYSGYFSTASAANRSGTGSYWSSTASSIYNSYYLSLYSSSLYPGTNTDYKYYGRSIRCLASS